MQRPLRILIGKPGLDGHDRGANMQTFKTTILVASLAALTGCASWDKSPICEKERTIKAFLEKFN